MIKLLLVILLSAAIFFFGFNAIAGKEAAPADTINSAKDAADQTRNLQDKINKKASDQLNQ